MWRKIIRNVIEPMERRIGSLIAGGLIAMGYETEANAIIIGIAAAISVTIDLLLSKYEKREIK